MNAGLRILQHPARWWPVINPAPSLSPSGEAENI